MSPGITVLGAAIIGAGAAVALAMFGMVPVPFPGASIAIAALLAWLFTLAILAWCPVSWLWNDDERLVLAFQARHRVSGLRANSALEAITTAHARAETLRRSSGQFQRDLRAKISVAADRLDGSAREIFYNPDRLNALRPILIRSELIEDAAKSHHALRTKRGAEDATATESRVALVGALDAMEQAFQSSDLSLAKGQLEQVKIASSVAESLLTPRTRLTDRDPS